MAQACTDMREVMKPCPFCGRKVGLVEFEYTIPGVSKLKVYCPCGAEIGIESDELVYYHGEGHQLGKSAIEKWNDRAYISKVEDKEDGRQ